jgi:hypothetical protein
MTTYFIAAARDNSLSAATPYFKCPTRKANARMLTVLLSACLTAVAHAQLNTTNLPSLASTNFRSYAEAINSGMDLASELLEKTNVYGYTSFDRQIVTSLPIEASPRLIVYQQFTIVFHYPRKEQRVESLVDMARLCGLISSGDSIIRTNSAEKVPVSIVRLVDPGVKEVEAEVNVLLGVSPLEDSQKVKYFKRSFRFLYRNKEWKYDESILR